MLSFIKFQYWSFTTLTTVGFGDLSPQSESERLFGGFLLLFGVMMFTYCMGIFIGILNDYNKFFADIEEYESDQLNLFFDCMKHLNHNHSYQEEFKNKIEDYFAYYWSKDKNMAVSKEEDIAILSQLPIFVQDNLYFKFLFNEIFKKHSSFFFINPRQMKIFSMGNSMLDHKLKIPQDMMHEFKKLIFSKLEPRFERKYTVLYNEFEDVGEINFINSGSVLIGFEINRVKKYALCMKAWNNEYGGYGFQIGAFEAALDHKTEFVYTAAKDIECLFIRRENWIEILKSFKQIAGPFVMKIFYTYGHQIRSKVNMIKRRAFNEML